MIAAMTSMTGATTGQDLLMRYVELRRHTDNEGDRLTPTEAAVLGLAGLVVPPLGKGKGVLLVEDGGDYQVEPLD